MTLLLTCNRLRAGSIPVLAAAAALFMSFSAPALAQSDPHHPEGEVKQAAPAQEIPMGGGMMGSGMMGMMRGGGMMGMMESCPMMGGTAHSEGRIAFLKAELAVTDQQKGVWEAYAAAAHHPHHSLTAHHAVHHPALALHALCGGRHAFRVVRVTLPVGQ